MWLCCHVSAHGDLFADVFTDSGTFSIQLHLSDAPLTVTHFLDLASGHQAWTDPITGAVKGGDGTDSFYSGFTFYSSLGSVALLGGLRPVVNESGGVTWTGPGYSIQDEWTNGTALARGDVAMAVFDGPHSGGAEIAFILSNTMANTGHQWTRFGSIASSDLAVLDAIANQVKSNELVYASITIRDEGISQTEIDQLAEARNHLPTVEPMPLTMQPGMQGTPTASFSVEPYAQATLATSTNLLSAGWRVLPGDWNFGTNALPRSLSVNSIPGLSASMGFVVGAQARYTEMTARLLPDTSQITMTHGSIDVVYELDFASGTGSMTAYQNDEILFTDSLFQLSQATATAYSTRISFIVGTLSEWYYDLYWLGFDEAGALDGRFYYESWYENWLRDASDWGNFSISHLDP